MVQILLPGMDISELAKLPDLVQHYQEHRTENPSISFFAFLELHYTNASHHEQDHERHHKLPFGNHNTVYSSFVVFTITTFETSFQKITESAVNNCLYQEPIEKMISFSIWQPPKV